MTRQRRTLALALLFLAAGGAAGAQSVDDLQVGARVRVTGEAPELDRIVRYARVGTVLSVDSIRLVVNDGESARMDTLPFFAIHRLDVSGGLVPRGRMVVYGGLGGAAIGVAAMLFAQAGNVDNSNGNGTGSAKPDVQHTARRAIPILAVCGMLVGATFSPEQWIRVRVPGALHPDP